MPATHRTAAAMHAFATPADIAADLAAERTARAEAVGLPGITPGTALTYTDDDGRTHRGEFVRVAAYGRGSRVAFLMVAVRTLAGEEIHVDPARVARAEAAALPECGAFAGTGSRCATCRVRRGMHR